MVKIMKDIKDSRELLDEVERMLKALGYVNFSRKNEEKHYDLAFTSPWDFGFEGFRQRHKDAVTLLTKGYLLEIYYLADRHHVLLYKELQGLHPDDDRYSTLIYTAMEVPHTETPCREAGKEVFINEVDHFVRKVKS